MMSFQSSPVTLRNSTTNASEPDRKFTCLKQSIVTGQAMKGLLGHRLPVANHSEENHTRVCVEEHEQNHRHDDEETAEHAHH